MYRPGVLRFVSLTNRDINILNSDMKCDMLGISSKKTSEIAEAHPLGIASSDGLTLIFKNEKVRQPDTRSVPN